MNRFFDIDGDVSTELAPWKLQALTAMVCCGFSGPLIVFLTPFFVWRFFIRKSGYNLCLAAMAILIAATQSVFVSRQTSLIAEVLQTGSPSVDYWSVAGQRLFGNLFLGSTLPFYLNPYILCGCGVLVLASVVCLGVKCGNHRHLTINCQTLCEGDNSE